MALWPPGVVGDAAVFLWTRERRPMARAHGRSFGTGMDHGQAAWMSKEMDIERGDGFPVG